MKNILVLGLLSWVTWANAVDEANFESLWAKMKTQSLHIKAQESEKEASDEGHSRAQRHWLPRAYLGSSMFETNDPTQIFFNNLGQRSVEQTDFMLGNLNNPDREKFRFTTIGVDLPLYEGGFKASQVDMLSLMIKANQEELKAKKTSEYTELTKNYISYASIKKLLASLDDLKNKTEAIVNRYQVGDRSNLVGHSGLLGLKGVQNRILGLSALFHSLKNSNQDWFHEKLQVSLSANEVSELKTFLDEKYQIVSSSGISTALLAQKYKAQTLDEVISMERARFLPRVGLFGQMNQYQGDRDTATAHAVGLYLQWDLFNPDSYGRVSQAKLKAISAENKIKAYEQDEKIGRQKLTSLKETLETNLKLLDESEKLLGEQTQNMMNLFKNGMINALQLAEVVNRRVDILENKQKLEAQYIDVRSELYKLNN
jgi:outer membrane protein TolC